ncbi:hybrid sensor histidine kinase/response regulator [Celeribacter sp. SCSIO 80788]|uniref:hybrid sensor histidine kinase/response regulator n=1 Tax=Celeribacter sp. SCSIO 80788 TaxID=3117013 RepID=UPI003DA55789
MKQSDLQSYSLLIEDAGRLSLLAHDIRATYSELQTALNTLGESAQVSPTLREELSRLSHAGAHLGRLLDEVSGALFHNHQDRPYPTLISTPRRSLAGLVQRWRGITEQLGSHLLLHGEAHMPETAAFDMLSFERALSNLVSNALHHAGPGPISIDISRSGQGPREELLVRIRDAGPGFPAEVLASVGPKPLPIGSGEPGSGFGLRIACEATRQLGGQLTLHNPPDGGAEACLSLPLAELALPTESGRDLIPALPSGLTALLVEDSAALRLHLRHTLEAFGLRVVEAPDGAAALHLLSTRNSDFDIVFLDIELPLLSGHQVLSLLRSRDIPVPPVIAVTSHVFDDNILSIRNSGADAVLCKPVSSRKDIVNSLLHALHLKSDHPAHALSASRHQPQSDALNAPLTHGQGAAGDRPDTTEACLRKMVRHLPEDTRQKLLRQVAADLDQYLEAAFAAARAAVGAGPRAELSRCTHTLSGLFASACHEDARQIAHALSERATTAGRTEIIAVLGQLRQTVLNIKTAIHSIIDSETHEHVTKTHSDR